MSEHEVAFHIGTGSVVCTCGEYFRADQQTAYLLAERDAVSKWAEHLRAASGLSLDAAYETGWSDACADWLQQQSDPAWPIGRRKRVNYPEPSEWAEGER